MTHADIRRSSFVRLRVLGAVFAGGCVGGLVRYLVVRQCPRPPGSFPWPIFAVNVCGAFVLALLLVVVSEVLRRPGYLRPMVGTGFCGALTTMSSVVVTVDRLLARGQAPLAIGYLAASIAAGLAAGVAGLVVGRAVAGLARPLRGDR